MTERDGVKKFAAADADPALLRDADRCVKCALCLPVCPTYQRAREEGESPRGRVALVQGLVLGQLSPQAVHDHLDSCLACRACEKVCPAEVPYGAILDRGRARALAQRPRRIDRAVARLLDTPALLAALAGLQRAACRVPALRRWRRVRLPGPPPPPAVPLPVAAASRGTVALLRGCVSAAFDAGTERALGALLRHCGFALQSVDGCCGAIRAHGGDLAGARRRATALGARIDAAGTVAVVHPASGCAAAVRDYAWLSDAPGARAAAAAVVDPFELLHEAGLGETLARVPAATRHVALHLPCTQRNVLGGGRALAALIGAVPGVRVTALTGLGCCGAAGTHMLTRPAAARDYARRLLAPLEDVPPVDALLSANIGCAWHLRDTLGRQGPPVQHPASWLAARLAETVGPRPPN